MHTADFFWPYGSRGNQENIVIMFFGVRRLKGNSKILRLSFLTLGVSRETSCKKKQNKSNFYEGISFLYITSSISVSESSNYA